MKQVKVHGPGDVRIDEIAEPEPGPRDAVIRVSACGICGSDLRYVRLGGLARRWGRRFRSSLPEAASSSTPPPAAT
jgi:threonine dehydrogenase-like Zn-dependent dehydrogenase